MQSYPGIATSRQLRIFTSAPIFITILRHSPPRFSLLHLGFYNSLQFLPLLGASEVTGNPPLSPLMAIRGLPKSHWFLTFC